MKADPAIVQKIKPQVPTFNGMTPGCLMRELARLNAGQCVGEMALAGNQLHSATVRATRDTVTMRFYRELIDTNPESAHVIYRNIASIPASRLDDSSVMLADLAGRNTSS